LPLSRKRGEETVLNKDNPEKKKIKNGRFERIPIEVGN
jgi:hypothetical protein